MGSVLEKNSSQVRKRIERHSFDNEEGEEYEPSAFNGFGDYFRRKKIKLQNLDADMRAGSDKPQIFKGIVAHVTGYTQPPLHVLHREIVQHGGGFLQYLDSKTMATHIIASTLPPKKTVDFNRYRIVKPAWIMDSVAAGKLLPWAEYRVLDEGPRQKVLAFDGSKSLTQGSPRVKQGYREQTDNSFYTSQLKSGAIPSQGLSQVSEQLQTPSRYSPKEEHAAPESNEAAGQKSTDDSPSLRELDRALHKSPLLDRSGPLPETSPTKPPELESEVQRDLPERKEMTSEEHNAWLLSDPRLRKSSTANPEFLKQFYSESRLHHLSTWKADLKSKMQRLAAEKGLTEKTSKKRPGSRSYVLHVDFDSFFCAVSLKKNPEYVDKPTVVAHGTGNGSEIASCNYVARKFGVKNGMWMKRALDLCSDLKVLPYDFPAYEEASRQFYESIMDIGGLVQSVSIDEALIDATNIVLTATDSAGIGVDEGSIWREQEKADELAKSLRGKIKAKTGCDVSVGIGGNILQAKVALRKGKPAGQYHLKPEDVLDVIGELKVEDLPGVAYSIGGKLEEIGIKLVKDIRELSKERLAAALGPKTGEKLYEYARGIDRVEVGLQPPRKSVSAEVNWGVRFISQEEAEEFVYNLCKELEKRLLNEQVKGKQLTMKIMRRSLDAPLDPAKHLGHGKCDTFNKSSAFGVATHDYKVIGKEAVTLLRSYKFSPGDLRGLGVQMMKLEPIKGQGTGQESSQKRLSFAAFTGPSPGRKVSKPEAIDDGESPHKQNSSESRHAAIDPIADDPATPKKPKIHPAMALTKAAQSDDKANTPLNVSGTQFIMPSNPDPAIMAELPTDIRTKLMNQAKRVVGQQAESPLDGRSRSGSPMPAEFLPSQVDAEVFNALPEDMKAEVLASYGRRPAQTVRQQSPRKDALSTRKQTTPTKRGGGFRSLFGKNQRQRDAQAGLMQTNFRPGRPSNEPDLLGDVEELDPSFLAELPEDVRKEVIADHRRRRLAAQSGLDAPATRHHHADSDFASGQRKIEFPAPPAKISFANSRVSSTQEIKDMLDAWHTETQKAGPHKGDVEVLEKYLHRVVTEERDLEKVSTIVKWVNVIVDQDSREGSGKKAWRKAVQSIIEAVQGAMQSRGMAPLEF